MPLLYAQFSLVQFSTTIFPYIIGFILLINPKAIISQLLLNISSSLDIKKRNRISKRGNSYRIPIGISINLLLYPLIIIFIVSPIRKAQINLIIQSSRPLFLRIYKSLLYNTLLKAPLRSRLSIDIVYPRWAYYTAQILEVIRERAERFKRFFLAPIYIYSSSSYTSAASYIRSVTVFSRSFLRVFSREIRQQLSRREQSFFFYFSQDNRSSYFKVFEQFASLEIGSCGISKWRYNRFYCSFNCLIQDLIQPRRFTGQELLYSVLYFFY